MEKFDETVAKQDETYTRISNAISNVNKLGKPNITLGVILTRLAGLEKYHDNYVARHDRLLACKTEKADHPYFATDQAGLCEELYYAARGAFLDMKRELEHLEREQYPPPPPPPGDNQPRPDQAAISRQLPRIDLRSFSGNYTDWEEYKDLFSSLVGRNEHLSASDKLHYLKLSLQGDASRIIRSIPTTGDNYLRAWTALCQHYDNKRVLVNHHLDSLYGLRPAKAESSAEIKRLYHTSQSALGSLGELLTEKQLAETLALYHLARLMDPVSRRDWELHLGNTTVPPTLEQWNTFMLTRLRSLETLEADGKSRSRPPSTPAPKGIPLKTHHVEPRKSRNTCSCCSGDHYIAFCPKLQSMSLAQRRELVTSRDLCGNCLGQHQTKECRSSKRCRMCNQAHHSLLHQPSTERTSGTSTGTSPLSGRINETSKSSSHVSLQLSPAPTATSILLATALVNVYTPGGGLHLARALIDQGSQVSLVSDSLAQRMNLPRESTRLSLLGVSASKPVSPRGLATLSIGSRHLSTPSLSVRAYILPRLTSYVVPSNLKACNWPHLTGLDLADALTAPGRSIDLLLGADVYPQILQDGVRKGPPGTPVAQRTTFGWILSGVASGGSTNQSSLVAQSSLQCVLDTELADSVQRFWTQEESMKSSPPPLTDQEQECEAHFQRTHRRSPTGRYIVQLPFSQPTDELGDSYAAARCSLLSMEKRFLRNDTLCQAYQRFMAEYEQLEHMAPVPSDQVARCLYLLPHHGVLGRSEPPKLRVVFNGSQKTTSGTSLNQLLHVGPRLQPDIDDVISRWRRHAIVFSSDIEKMYRQIDVDSMDTYWQCILWRSNPSEDIRPYRLTTVTYGLSCAPYLAIRTLHQLVMDEGHHYPLGAEALKNDAYVDDVLTGADTAEQALLKRDELIKLLTAGGFTLKKWTSNSSEVLTGLPRDYQEKSISLGPTSESTFRMLGLVWIPRTDAFTFHYQGLDDVSTKRGVLSRVAQLYDPLGWISPVIVSAKILIQDLWMLGIGWDKPLPAPILTRWQTYIGALAHLKDITVPRWLGTHSSILGMELHGFCDASERAFGAVIYLRVLNDIDDISISLVSARTRVAPLKKQSLPRLELCGATLLSRLVVQVQASLSLADVPVHLWTDSTITLAWIRASPARWKTFVANRTSEIQSNVPAARWHHVPSQDNPADCASRGLSPPELAKHELWWTGPSWLLQHSALWPTESLSPLSDDLEEKVLSHPCTVQAVVEPPRLLRYSSLQRLLRISAWRLRYWYRLQHPGTPTASATSSAPSEPAPLTPHELDMARRAWIRRVQHLHYPGEITTLKQNRPLPPSSSLSSLTPFLDSHGLLRVGGRLKNSILDADQRHPIILPPRSRLTYLIIDQAHHDLLHGGTQLMLGYLRRQYWIPRGRAVIRSHIGRCVQCVRHKAQTSSQLMGQLPASRSTPSRPFLHSGVDYAGPLLLKTWKGRGHRSYKGYVALFVCLATRAVHLEAVSDLTAAGFIAAYQRFAARRGICATITSDNGTNLVGAAAELRRMFTAASYESKIIANHLSADGTEWKFLPPAAPHFGGIWEAGVKSVKFHLRRVIGDNTLTFEELSTLLAQIEACLNSRPLGPISDDPDDLAPLTPGHFLVGSVLKTLPEPSLLDTNFNTLSRWQRIRSMLESFWARWQTEYLQGLNARPKWRHQKPPVKIGDLAVLKDERMPPSTWRMCRVVETHPGSDGEVRAVTVRTQDGTFRRPIVKLCLLPPMDSS